MSANGDAPGTEEALLADGKAPVGERAGTGTPHPAGRDGHTGGSRAVRPAAGRSEGHAEGHAEGYAEGHAEGYAEGYGEDYGAGPAEADPAGPGHPAGEAATGVPRQRGTGSCTPADAADAARLVAFGLQPKLPPARDPEYQALLRRYREDPTFARVTDAVATGLGLVVLEVSPRAGMAVAAAEGSVFAVRMGDYARRAATDATDRFLHGLAHLAVAALAFPRPQDLADDGYVGRITVNGVDAFVRQACRRLEERARQRGENTDPASDTPGLEAAWRVWARRSATGATKDTRRLAGSTTGIVAKAVAFLADSGFLQRVGDDAGGTYRTTPRYQLQVRDMAGSAALSELLELGVVPVSDGTASLLPPDESDPAQLAADAGLPFHD